MARPSRIRTVLGSALYLLLLAPPGAAGQVPVQVPPAAPRETSLQLRVERLYQEGRHRASLEILRNHLGDRPEDYPAWVLAARAALVLGVASAGADSARSWLHRAIEYGDGAVRLQGEGPDGRYLRLAAKGRLALVSGELERASLGREVEEEAHALLALDSTYAGAHNALGRLYLEVSRVSGIKRLLGRPWLGGELLDRASWESAERHLRKAVELQPERNFHHLDLGLLLFLRDRDQEARSVLEGLLDVPLETPQQEIFRREARELLGRLEDEASGHALRPGGRVLRRGIGPA